MKFGKSYMETLASPSFPEDWRRGAIEYKQLKKLINGVVAELESLGLSASVLGELLAQQERQRDERNAVQADADVRLAQTAEATPKAQPLAPPADPVAQALAQESLLPPPAKPVPSTARDWLESVPHSAPKRTRAHGTRLAASDTSSLATNQSGSYPDGTTSCSSCYASSSSHPTSVSPTSTASTSQSSSRKEGPSQSHSPDATAPPAPSVLKGALSTDFATTESEVEFEQEEGHTEWVEGRGGRRAHAAYELGGTAEHPVPRIRITIESPVTTDDEWAPDQDIQAAHITALTSDLALSDTGAQAENPQRSFHYVVNGATYSSAAMQAEREEDIEADWEGDSEAGDYADPLPTPTMRRGSHGDSMIKMPFTSVATASRETLRAQSGTTEPDRLISPPVPSIPSIYSSAAPQGLSSSSASELASDHDSDLQNLRCHSGVRYPPRKPGRHRASKRALPHRVRVREMTIPLVADALFLNLFTSALIAVQSVQALQRSEFIAATERVTKAIGDASSPYGAKSDLYNWRDIFHLYNDCQVFESTREKDAGELDPDESERRLIGFANQLYQRGWLEGPITPSRVDTKDILPHPPHAQKAAHTPASAPAPMGPNWLHGSNSTLAVTQRHHDGDKLSPHSAQALTDFLTLNVALLDVKKYQRLNLEAARKILKKHDKRTALTAGTDLRAFMVREHDRSPERTQCATDSGSAPPLAPRPDPTAIANALAQREVEVDHIKLKRLLRRPWKKSVPGAVATMPTLETGPVLVPDDPSAGGARARALAPVTTAVPSLEALLPLTGPGGILGPGKESESLAHILFSLMSSQLMPILPSLDDYACFICFDVAWRPIRLDCNHLFCIRCLVKLQKQGRRACPLCRAADAVGSAGERNLDTAMTNMLKIWFPREVRAKDRENEQDRRQEERKELGFTDDRCMVM